jgi:hypothetical protein
MRRLMFCTLFALSLACGSDEADNNATTNTNNTTADMSGQADQNTTDMRSADSGADMASADMASGDMASGDMGSADMAAVDMAPDMNMMLGDCPEARLTGPLPVSYQGSTKGATNLFESNRLEWGPAGDVALLFVVPETASYTFDIGAGLTDNQGCGVSINNNAGGVVFHDVNLCPADGMVRQLPDAFFVAGEGFNESVELQANQELLVLISCATWSMPTKEVDFTLTIDKK